MPRQKLVWCGLLLASFSGCGATGPDHYAVTGQVFYQGHPAVGAIVILQPEAECAQNPAFAKCGFPRAEVGQDGSFQMTTARASDGAPPGKYIVCITWPVLAPLDPERAEQAEINPDRFQNYYNNPAAPIYKFTVDKKPSQIPKCELP